MVSLLVDRDGMGARNSAAATNGWMKEYQKQGLALRRASSIRRRQSLFYKAIE
jgi:hypothetical protein